MKRAVSKGNPWHDHYSLRAKKERFPARSAYKLQEMQKKFNLIKRGHHVLDLGCAPGSWLLYAANLTGPTGRVVGIDLKPVTVDLPPYVRTHIGDIERIDDELLQTLGKNFNVVISDLAPATTGNKVVDSSRSFNLSRSALAVAQHVLVSKGSFVCKIFHGEDFKPFTDSVRSVFNIQKQFKPQSSRKASKEIYIVGLGKKQEVTCRGTANGQLSDIKKG